MVLTRSWPMTTLRTVTGRSTGRAAGIGVDPDIATVGADGSRLAATRLLPAISRSRRSIVVLQLNRRRSGVRGDKLLRRLQAAESVFAGPQLFHACGMRGLD